MPASNQVSFHAHVALLQSFVAHRDRIVERIQALLAAGQDQRAARPDRALLARQFEDSFFTQPGLAPAQASLRGQLQQAHWAHGFRPRDMPGVPNEMFDPADMMGRAFTVWRHTRWPGRNGRMRYAHTLFNLYVVRCLTLLSMRVCDQGPADAGERLAQLQTMLDALWASSPADQPVLVRDVRWLVPVAQSPTTDDLAPYFDAACKLEECLPAADRLEIDKASVLMAGGHLRSQLRHFTMQGRSLHEEGLILSTRGSNALDCAMTIQHLVPLLEAFDGAVAAGDAARRALAGVICQGISADPELYVNRLDLLGAYSMIQHLFVTTDDAGNAVHTPTGQRHVRLLQRYVGLMERLAALLYEDCPHFRPAAGNYSPYGVMFGFSSNILEHMTLKALQPDAETRFTLEDVFADDGHGAQRLAWVSGWRRLPHVPAQVQKLYDYPQQFAEEIFARIEKALRDRAGADTGATRTGRMYIGASGMDEIPLEHVLSSAPAPVEAGKAQPCDPARLLADRQEGMFLVSYETAGGWVAISKDVLTGVLGAGRDVNAGDLPHAAAGAAELMYPQLVVKP